MKKINKVLSFIFLLALAFMPSFMLACDSPNNSLSLASCGIIHEQEFGGVYIKSTIEDFNQLGFKYGDSVNVTFSNGYELRDIPYYNGYYTKTGEPLLIAYPGYDYIKVAINNGDDLWSVAGLGGSTNTERHFLWATAGLDDNMTAKVTLSSRGKYIDVQEARDIHYFDDRTLYSSDEVFANFRALRGGDLKENVLYRSASPCDNQHNRAKYVDRLMARVGIDYVINLADTDQKIQGYMTRDDFESTYFASLYDASDVSRDNVEPLALNMNFESEYFRGQVIKALVAIANNDGPFLIHCTEGKDRTGFLCMLLEAFAGASYSEIVEDYMMTYFNYYAITKAFDAKRYDVIVSNVLNPMIEIIAGAGVDIKTVSLAPLSEQFLLYNGMSSTQISALRAKICN